MRIVCPACSAIYEVPDRLLDGGKRLRCARCSHEWNPPELVPPPAPELAPPAPTPSPPAPPPPEPPGTPEVLRDLALPVPEARPVPPAQTARVEPPALHGDMKPRPTRPAPPAARSRLPVLLALGTSVAVVAALLAAGFVWRAWLMQAWPPSQRLFMWLGLGSG